ncbi:MAG TPA: hypothetical protein VG538_00010 [Vicinamibacterales bacterium]|nr:hypothetical protein [Vicinamibacterales bacterium]
MGTPYLFWPWCCGLLAVVIGVIVARRDLKEATGLEKLVVLGPVLFAGAVAAFAAEHFTLTSFVRDDIPSWMPGRLFLAYFVGVALYATALSFVTRQQVWLSANLFALMLLIFVVVMHVPNALRAADRITWTVALRDFSFGAGALALAGVEMSRRGSSANASWRMIVGRVVIAAACVVFGVLQILHPLHAPGVPLQKLTPDWIPAPAVLGVVFGAIQLAAGVLMFVPRRARAAALWLSVALLVVLVVVYLPLVVTAADNGARVEAENYVWDTVLVVGTVLLAARAAKRV